MNNNNHWVLKPRPNPQARLRLFCLPYAGGGAQVFRTWAQKLPALVEVCPIELPGRGSRLQEPLFTQVPPLVAALTEQLEPHLDKPFAFFGHSMGALLSFEVARHLRRRQRCGPIGLFVSGRGAPHVPTGEPPIHALPEAEFLNELRRFNGTPQEVLEHRELMQLLLPILRADFTICETYQYLPEAPLTCPVTAFGGLSDKSVTVERLEAWRAQTSAAFAAHLFSGDHFFLHTAQSSLLQMLAERLNHLLNARAPLAYG